MTIFLLADLSLAVRNLIQAVLGIASFLLLVYVLLDLARNFVRDLPPIFITLHEGLARFWEPILRPIRNALPPLGGIDFSPLLVLLALQFVSQLLV